MSSAANIVRIGVTKIEFKWAASSGGPDGYLVSRSNKGGPFRSFAWVTEPRIEMPVAPGDQITITVKPGSRSSAGSLFLGPSSAQSDRVWVLAAPTFPVDGEWLLRCTTCPSVSQRLLEDPSVVLAEVPAFPATWRPLGRAAITQGRELLLWYNQNSGFIAGWDTQELVTTLSSTIVRAPLRGVGPADFDRDGTEELVVQRTDTGQILLLGRTAQGGLGQVAALPAPGGAELAAARDFTRDGTVDFIWRNYATGTLTLQSVLVDPKLNPPFAQLYGQPRTIRSGMPSDRFVASTGDYDGDRWVDLLWRNGDGQLHIAYLVNGQLDEVVSLASQAQDVSRFVVGSVDIDGIPGEEIALQDNATKEMSLVFPAKATTAQRMKWLHPGAQWRALRWDY